MFLNQHFSPNIPTSLLCLNSTGAAITLPPVDCTKYFGILVNCSLSFSGNGEQEDACFLSGHFQNVIHRNFLSFYSAWIRCASALIHRYDLRHLSYPERLNRRKFFLLRKSRLWGDLMVTYEFPRDAVPVYPRNSEGAEETSPYSHKTKSPHFYFKKILAIGTTDPWSHFSSALDKAHTIDFIKSQLDKCMGERF